MISPNLTYWWVKVSIPGMVNQIFPFNVLKIIQVFKENNFFLTLKIKLPIYYIIFILCYFLADDMLMSGVYFVIFSEIQTLIVSSAKAFLSSIK
jgi:hypothetical protein